MKYVLFMFDVEEFDKDEVTELSYEECLERSHHHRSLQGPEALQDYLNSDEVGKLKKYWVRVLDEIDGADTRTPPANPDQWRCESCGSLDVQQQGWIDPNTGKVVTYNDCDRGDLWCERCEEHNNLIMESELMKRIDEWFANQLLPDDDEVISGLNRDDYASDEEYDAARKEHWNARSNDEKIQIWHELTRDKSNDK